MMKSRLGQSCGVAVVVCATAFAFSTTAGLRAGEPYSGLKDGIFQWSSSGPLIEPLSRGEDECVSIKDPSVVFYQGKWHVFCTVRFRSRRVQLEYLQFADWSQVGDARRELLNLHDGYIAAPQVFYFTPHKKWYLVYQMADEPTKRPFGPWFSTTATIDVPDSWTAPEPLYRESPAGQRWLDFWIICDADKAHLFNTSNDGKMWRAETSLSEFPFGWTRPQVVFEGDIFEASETYRLSGMNQFLTIIEAQGNRRRYHKAYVADRLDGEWKPLAASVDKPLASFENVEFPQPWSTNISHGELIRDGHDEHMLLDPQRLQLLYQGANDREYRDSGGYAFIPWRLGLLTTK